MADLRRSALADRAALLAELSIGGAARLREVPFPALFLLRGDSDEAGFRAALAAAIGLEPPVTPNTVAAGEGCEALWLGPDEWLLVGADAVRAGLAGRLAEGLAALRHQLLDVSAGRTVLELCGPAARAVLGKGCSLDLHPRAFSPGRCAQTALARAQMLLQQRDAEPTYRLFLRRSFALYALAWLAAAMAEYRHQPRAAGA